MPFVRRAAPPSSKTETPRVRGRQRTGDSNDLKFIAEREIGRVLWLFCVGSVGASEDACGDCVCHRKTTNVADLSAQHPRWSS